MLREVDVQGYIPAMRAGIHTGRPLSIGTDLVGVDVNIAARLMESAGTGGVLISGATLKHLAPKQLGEFGVVARKLRRAAFSARPRGVPADIAIYQLEEKGREEPNQVDELVAAG